MWRGKEMTNEVLALLADSITDAVGQKHALDLLIGFEGVNVNHADLNGNTAMHYVAKSGNVGLFRFLLDHGAKMGVRNKFGMTPLHKAVKFGNLDLVYLMHAAGEDINAKDGEGYTSLHIAVSTLDVRMVEILLNRKADKTITNNKGKTPFDLAMIIASEYACDEEIEKLNSIMEFLSREKWIRYDRE
jgi:ankyrin repeat protein